MKVKKRIYIQKECNFLNKHGECLGYCETLHTTGRCCLSCTLPMQGRCNLEENLCFYMSAVREINSVGKPPKEGQYATPD